MKCAAWDANNRGKLTVTSVRYEEVYFRVGLAAMADIFRDTLAA